MVEGDFVERGRGGEGGDVTTNAFVFTIRPDNHRHRVPADDALDSPLQLTVSREGGLTVGRNRVDVRRGDDEGNLHPQPVRLLFNRMKQIARTVSPPAFEHIAERVKPLLGLGRIGINGDHTVSPLGLTTGRITRLAN